ncbi:unnamed protein product, partial [Heterosigma akashiwo]
CLRVARKKDLGSSSNVRSLYEYCRSEFREQASKVKKSDFQTIEHMIRHGKKQMKL